MVVSTIHADTDPVSETLVYHVLSSRANGSIHVDTDPVSEIRGFLALSSGLIVLYYTVLLNIHIPYV